MGVFDPNMIHISHKSIRSEDISNNADIYISSEVIDYANFGGELDSVILNWKYSSEDGPFAQIPLQAESSNIYGVEFPLLNANSTIEYFIRATNSNGNVVSHPNAGWHIFDTLAVTLGDVNQDTIINIQDIILIVNIILNNEYNIGADMNNDNSVNVADIILVVNIILNNRTL